MNEDERKFTIADTVEQSILLAKNTTVIKQNKRKILVIITQVRSGSNFMADFLSSLPKVYLSKEPMRSWANGSFTITNNTYNESINFMRDLMQCNFAHCKHFVKHQETQLAGNRREYCIPTSMSARTNATVYCTEGQLLTTLCLAASVHVLKIVVLKLKDMVIHLAENKFDIRIIHLLRDPRGILSSLDGIDLGREFFHKPDYFCRRMQEDLKVANEIKTKYTGR